MKRRAEYALYILCVSAKTLPPSREAQDLRNYSKLKIWQPIQIIIKNYIITEINVNIGVQMLTIRKCSKIYQPNKSS